MAESIKTNFYDGLKAAIPIALGYFFVSIGVGCYAIKAGMTPFQATMMSMLNLTSAGEISAIKTLEANGGYLELFLSQIVINARYALMGISLQQKKYSTTFKLPKRLLASYGITDEIFASSITQKKIITPIFFVPLIILPIIGWSSGTLLGAVGSHVLSEDLVSSLQFLIFSMLICIITPEAKKSKPIFLLVLLSGLLSSILHYFLPFIQPGYSIIISSIISSTIISAIFPIDIPKTDDNTKQEQSK